ncbi:TRAP transporter TatT component family protein [Zoogloea sp.]|uniref:TRAP transporter TatT component family protein n=1 Tax=Zoogloea sp. TaxID=49181 RepID=UPI0025EA0047|nr:TRAP transporter TatT component family protein [Zoogloea sp.]MCK6392422.1 TRAP transporter TatT component family protein [Zoogloea sp.]
MAPCLAPRSARLRPASLARALLLPLLALSLCACAPRQLVLNEMADSLAGQGQSAEDDPELARDAAAFYLKLSESVLREQPGHLPLAGAVAGGFTQYAYAFVAFEADRLETTDARAAARLRSRAANLYRRGRDHALSALETSRPGLRRQLDGQTPLPPLPPQQRPLAYWAAAAWGGLISLSKDDPDTVADLPAAIRLARLAWDSDPTYGDGALASLMGSFEAARPGGSRAQAEAYFDEALRLGAGHNAGAFVAKAEGHAQPAGDKAAFLALLHQALAVRDTPGSPLTLSNAVMRRRAEWLISTADDLF